MTKQELNRANELACMQNRINCLNDFADRAIIVRKPIIRGLDGIFGEEVSASFIEEVTQFAENRLTTMLQKKYDEVTNELENI